VWCDGVTETEVKHSGENLKIDDVILIFQHISVSHYPSAFSYFVFKTHLLTTMIESLTAESITVVLVPWDDSKPLITLIIVQSGIASIVDPSDPTNVVKTLLIRPIHQQPGLYAHHEPSTQYPNVRATRLAMACGLFRHRFHGDVILSRGPHLRRADILAACCISADLRPSMISHTKVPEWLANACRNNYHDAAVLTRLADVMNRPDGCDEDDDSDSSVDDDGSNDEESLGNSQIDKAAKDEIVTKVTLCLYCRRPASKLCEDCSGAYFCEPPATCRTDG
jgi:hypothetical protein